MDRIDYPLSNCLKCLGGNMKRTVIFILVLFLAIGLWADSLEDTVEELSGTAAKEFVSPIVSAFGTNMNGGWFHKVPKKSFLGIDLEVGFVFMATTFPDDAQTFSTEGSFSFTRSQAEELVAGVSDIEVVQNALIEKIINQEFDVGVAGPTIIGPQDENIMITFYDEEIDLDTYGSFTIPGHVVDSGVSGQINPDLPMPLMAPQIGIGTFFGTKLYARYMPTLNVPDIGDINYFGIGFQHNVKAWIPVPLPIDVSIAAFTQTLNIGDLVEASASTIGLNAGKTLGLRFLSITPYAGLMYEQSNMTFKYDFVVGENPVTNEEIVTKVKFDLEGENSSRLVLGASLRMGLFNFSGDYNIGKYNSFTASAGVAF